jgi:hypothetical protein
METWLDDIRIPAKMNALYESGKNNVCTVTKQISHKKMLIKKVNGNWFQNTFSWSLHSKLDMIYLLLHSMYQ